MAKQCARGGGLVGGRGRGEEMEVNTFLHFMCFCNPLVCLHLDSYNNQGGYPLALLHFDVDCHDSTLADVKELQK